MENTKLWEDMTGAEQYRICKAMTIRACTRLNAQDRLPELRVMLQRHDLDELIAETWADAEQSKRTNDGTSVPLRVFFAACNAVTRIYRADKKNSHSEYNELISHAERFEGLVELQEALEHTDEKNRVIIRERLTGYTMQEIASVLGISQQAISKRLRKLAAAV